MKESDNGESSSPEKAKKPAKSNESPAKKQKTADKKSEDDLIIPSIFSEKKFVISKKVNDIDKLNRYIRAYDGEVLDEMLAEDATHAVVSSKEEKVNKPIIQVYDMKYLTNQLFKINRSLKNAPKKWLS